CLQYISAPLTF
nr:immunoglobulin light chain junction region [Macaca mulatta]